MPPGSPGKYLVARLGGGDVAAISTPPDGATGPTVWNTYVSVDSADETTAKVREAGGSVVMDPFDVFEAGRMAVLSDSEGAVFSVWQAKEHRGARIVNEASALTFNGLNTRDQSRHAAGDGPFEAASPSTRARTPRRRAALPGRAVWRRTATRDEVHAAAHAGDT
jgi:hypothetical protein